MLAGRGSIIPVLDPEEASAPEGSVQKEEGKVGDVEERQAAARPRHRHRPRRRRRHLQHVVEVPRQAPVPGPDQMVAMVDTRKGTQR